MTHAWPWCHVDIVLDSSFNPPTGFIEAGLPPRPCYHVVTVHPTSMLSTRSTSPTTGLSCLRWPGSGPRHPVGWAEPFRVTQHGGPNTFLWDIEGPPRCAVTWQGWQDQTRLGWFADVVHVEFTSMAVDMECGTYSHGLGSSRPSVSAYGDSGFWLLG